jgi:hypothetical protein
MTNAASRLLADSSDQAYDTTYVNNDKNFNWQREMEHKYKGKPRTPGRVLPEGTFTKSPSEIAHILKQHSESFAQAMAKLSSYINRSGRDLQGSDKERLYSAKDALRNAYGQPAQPATPAEGNTVMTPLDDNTNVGFDETRIGEIQGSSEIPIYGLPPGHNMDDAVLDTGIDSEYQGPPPEQEVPDMAVPLNAAARLLGSIQNSVQDPGNDTHISHTVEADKWSQKVTDSDDKGAVPDGTFKGSAEDIAKTLKRVSKDHKQAADRLAFYRNRGGSKLPGDEKSKLDKAQQILKDSYGT